ncbi:hypothetical protein GCM10023185_45760 [Hymenobacter saemangeumensis]|uniref:Uncharacterized protein n=1 Tax=Hymenobacter saemangeumensis TaxID=1084522 RepID=A0ABP8ISZ3_9BACT
MKLLQCIVRWLVLLVICQPAQAQEGPYLISLPPHNISLAASPWRVAQVLDLRADRSRLGAVHRGLDNQLSSANFPYPLATELRQWVHPQPTTAGRPVLMRVFTLSINERLGVGSEQAEAELIADFLELQPDSTFRALLMAGETTHRAGLDATGLHAANLALVLQQALRRLAALPATSTSAETLSPADARAGRGGAMAHRFAIQQAATPRRGFYRSFEEFRDNKPSEPDFPFYVEHKPRPGKRFAGTDAITPNYLHLDEQHPARPVPCTGLWGLSDGRELLMVYRGRFYQLLPAADGRSYTFMGPPVLDAEGAANVTAAALVGGLAGAAIASVANSAGPLALYELHLASGRVVPAETAGTDAQGFATAADSAGVFVFRRSGGNDGQSVTLSATDQPATALAARSWTAIRWRDRRRELKLCVQVGSGRQDCQEFIPDFSQPTFLECIVPSGGDPPILRVVSAKEGRFEVKRMQLLERKKK